MGKKGSGKKSAADKADDAADEAYKSISQKIKDGVRMIPFVGSPIVRAATSKWTRRAGQALIIGLATKKATELTPTQIDNKAVALLEGSVRGAAQSASSRIQDMRDGMLH